MNIVPTKVGEFVLIGVQSVAGVVRKKVLGRYELSSELIT